MTDLVILRHHCPVVEGTHSTYTVPGLRYVYSFFQIPYAADTSGANRFRPPQPRAPWTDTLDVQAKDRMTTYQCIQENATGPGTLVGTEDCLRLNVYSPKIPTFLNPNPNLPVLVWIYGGAFISGNTYIFNHWKFLDHNVVLVVPNYRVGALGFLSTQTDDAPGNAGLYDQYMALKWVKDNIKNFGGNPDQITLFGESAGAVSVGHHYISPLSRGLFHRAILQSGSPLTAWSIDERPLEYHNRLAPATNCPWNPSDPSPYLSCLRNLDPLTLIMAQKNVITQYHLEGQHGFNGVSPVVQVAGGGYDLLIREDPYTALTAGRHSGVPVILGCNKHEGTFVLGLLYNEYLVPKNLVDDPNFLSNSLVTSFTDAVEIDTKDASALESYYFSGLSRNTFTDLVPGFVDFLGATFIKQGSYEMAMILADQGVDTWFYSFEYYGAHTMFDILFPEPPNSLPFGGGVTHADDLIYQWGLWTLTGTDNTIKKYIVRSWVNFAYDGVPTTTWPKLKVDTQYYLAINQDQGSTNQEQIYQDYSQTYTTAVDEYFSGVAIPGTTSRRLQSLETFTRLNIMETAIQEEDRLSWGENDEEELANRMAYAAYYI
ncbi:unnamed protein product [Cyprideis torosa]|uniref:Carboxylic ester hydrolase n=1 Tax=Cyprideis torosa TaxID=163714 RepID=A0A7R8ZP79_9CRUS|nr:unnamed protein product [Cyprideis torosa]CAG0889266.1 unnamed protein product [Cyprideis torosa]